MTRLDSVESINFAWLLRLRWGALALQAVLFAAVELVIDIDVAWVPVVVMFAIELVSNLIAARWVKRSPRIAGNGLPLLLTMDVTLFTGLLFSTGGAANPFSFLYLVYIALGAVVLRPRPAWFLAALAFGGFGLTFVVGPHAEHMKMMQMHLRGMWVAFGVAAAFIVYFTQRVTRALAERDAQLFEARARSSRQERLASLATLAAGAAHELSTPLSVIAVVAKELERTNPSGPVGADVALIRQQVERCRTILSQMAADVGAAHGETPQLVPVSQWVRSAIDGLPGEQRLQLELDDASVSGPPRALAQALRSLLKNALQASPREAQVRVTLRGDRLEVQDRGTGMPIDVLSRAGEPFFTTKEPGEGMGLGLFLTRAVIEQLGGRLELTSRPGEGTTASLVLPTAAIHRSSAAGATR